MSTIPQGSKVLVTGANGFLGAHVVDQLLSAGYRVRGTVRSQARGQWLVDHFTKTYGPERFELAIVSDMSLPSAFDKALSGVSGVAHVASDVTFNPNVDEVMAMVEGAINSLLESAAKNPEIKRFVLTSSSVAAIWPLPGQKSTVTKDSWNDHSVEQAYGTDEAGKAMRGFHVYSASKVASERALWNFAKDQRPSFVSNAVLPDFISGKVISRQWGQSGSTGGMIVDLYAEKGEKQDAAIGMLKSGPPRMSNIPFPSNDINCKAYYIAEWMVDVADTARLHVAALTDVDIVNERLFAFSEVYNFNDILVALKKVKPEHELPAKSDTDIHSANTIEPRGRAEEILKKHFGRGFKTLNESVAESVEDL